MAGSGKGGGGGGRSAAGAGVVAAVGIGGLTWAAPPRGYVMVKVDLGKLNASLEMTPSFHVGPGGTGPSAKPGAYANVAVFIARARRDGTAVEAPKAGIGSDGNAHIVDGRHRLAYFTDRGLKAVPVAVHRSESAEFRKRFGAG